mgnify:CR=1 FL=1
MKIVIIGFGGMGSYHSRLLKEYAKDGDLELCGIYDIDPERVKAAEEQGIKAYASPEEIWNDKNVDAVLIATPNDVHEEYVEAAAAAKKNIICEKPIACNSAQAERMYNAAEKAGVVFEVHQNRRWDDDYLTVKNIIAQGKIGDTYRIESRVMGANGIPGAWRKEKKRGGGMMLDWGVHLIDQILLAVPSKVESLFCEYSYIYGEEVDDGFDLLINFENGVKSRIIVATDCFRPMARWQVYGTQGTATIQSWDLSGGITCDAATENTHIEGIRAGNGFTRTMAPRTGNSVQEYELPIVHAEPFAFYKNFVAACEGRENALIRREQVLRVFRLMEAAERSAAENVVIKEKI